MNEPKRAISVLAALGLELKPLARALRAKRGKLDSGQPAFFADVDGAKVVLGTTGIGSAAGAATADFLAACPSRAVLSTGTAGGLAPTLRCGDGVVCPRVLMACENSPPAREADAVLLGLVKDLLSFDAVTVAEAVESPAEKEALHHRTGAAICEMESHHVMGAAQQAGLPSLTLRVVSDTSREALPRFNCFVRNGKVNKLRMAEHFALHPEEALRFARLARASKQAAARLPEFLIPLLRAMVRELS